MIEETVPRHQYLIDKFRTQVTDNLGERPDRKIRLRVKDEAIKNIARTNLAKGIIKALVRVDDFLQEVAIFHLEITPENFISTSVRRVFGLSLPVEPLAPAANIKNAKSKWHEIMLKAEKIKTQENQKRREEFSNYSPPLPDPVRGQLSKDLLDSMENPFSPTSATKSTDTLVNSGEAVGDTSQHANVLNK